MTKFAVFYVSLALIFIYLFMEDVDLVLQK
jgi:hypothetical protein